MRRAQLTAFAGAGTLPGLSVIESALVEDTDYAGLVVDAIESADAMLRRMQTELMRQAPSVGYIGKQTGAARDRLRLALRAFDRLADWRA